MSLLEPRWRICLALDVGTADAAIDLARQVSPYVGLFKVGFELFVSEGPSIIARIREIGDVFLDLKFHDIPNTVAGATRAAVRMGVSFLNVHCAGGSAMLLAAADAAMGEADRLGALRPKVLAVTVLTSIDEAVLRNEILVGEELQTYVVHLAAMAKGSGIDGVIASPQEIGPLREACGGEFVIGTPGIRPPGSPPDDQRRTLSPGEAVHAGADFIVVGRPIRDAADPALAAAGMRAEIESVA